MIDYYFPGEKYYKVKLEAVGSGAKVSPPTVDEVIWNPHQNIHVTFKWQKIDFRLRLYVLSASQPI